MNISFMRANLCGLDCNAFYLVRNNHRQIHRNEIARPETEQNCTANVRVCTLLSHARLFDRRLCRGHVVRNLSSRAKQACPLNPYQ